MIWKYREKKEKESKEKEKKTKKKLIDAREWLKENVLTKPSQKNEFDLDDLFTGSRKRTRESHVEFISVGKPLRISRKDSKSQQVSLKNERSISKAERKSFNPFQDPKAWSRKTSILQSGKGAKPSFMNNKNPGKYLRTGYDELGRRKEFRVENN
mmetsp:Transcript_17371/g.22146  ORF Transcript_17371/g.22146 Transcript_17371/m.22146 type:complete len:155 (+) Transcript_17371:104-568(+)